MLLLLPLMELFLLVSILKNSIMLSLPLQVNQESAIFKVLDEFLEKEKDKVKATLYDIADDCSTKTQEKIIHSIIL